LFIIKRNKNLILKLIAHAISVLTNPLIIIYFMISVSYYDLIVKDISLFYILLFSLYVPTTVYYLMNVIKIDGFKIEKLSLDQNLRNPLFAYLLSTLIINYFFFNYIGTNEYVQLVLVLIIYISLLLFFNKLIDKVSMHASANTLFIMSLASKIDPLFLLLMLMLPLIFWSRIYLHRHTLNQLIFGSLIGLVCGLLIWIF